MAAGFISAAVSPSTPWTFSYSLWARLFSLSVPTVALDSRATVCKLTLTATAEFGRGLLNRAAKVLYWEAIFE
jgi:hypothetical protein